MPVTLTGHYYQLFSRYSASFSFLADVTLLVLGGLLKRKEKLSGRFADALSYLYLGTATLKHFKDAGEPKADLPLVEWSCQHCLFEIQIALDGILRNYPIKPVGWLLRGIIFPLGRRQRRPADALGHKVARLLLAPSDTRDRLTSGMYINQRSDDITGCLEDTLAKVLKAEPILKRVKEKGHRFEARGDNYAAWINDLVSESVLNQSEADVLIDAQASVTRVIQVDHFPAASELRAESVEQEVA